MYNLATTILAMAPGAGGEGGSNIFSGIIPIVLIFAIFYFLLIRPQQKKAKAHRQLVSDLKKGDEVVTDSGILGTIQKVSDDYVTLDIAPKVPIRIVRSRVAEVVKRSKSS